MDQRYKALKQNTVAYLTSSQLFYVLWRFLINKDLWNFKYAILNIRNWISI